MRHCYSTGEDLLLVKNGCKLHLATLLGYIKYIYLTENSGFFAEDSNFSSAQESKIFWLNQKTPTQNSTRRWGDCQEPPFSQFPLFRAGWGGSTTWGRNERGTANRQVSEMLQILGERGWDLQWGSLKKKERIYLWCSTSEEGQEVSP